jgi:hypothetical protein
MSAVDGKWAWIMVMEDMRSVDLPVVSLMQLREALEASWDCRTAYQTVSQPGNAALGQCYPTSRVVQCFFPTLEIVSGEVDTGAALEAHFWNIDLAASPPEHVDLSWKQFAPGAKVTHFKILDRHALNDSSPTIARCELLLERVLSWLEKARI